MISATATAIKGPMGGFIVSTRPFSQNGNDYRGWSSTCRVSTESPYTNARQTRSMRSRPFSRLAMDVA